MGFEHTKLPDGVNSLTPEGKHPEESRNEVVTTPAFTYEESSQREKVGRMIKLPQQHPDITDAYTQLADDPEFQSGVTPTYPTAYGASYDDKLRTMVRPTNPIAMAYLLDTAGVQNFRTIVSPMNSVDRAKLLQSVLKGETGAIFDLLQEDGDSRLARLDSGSLTEGSREDQLAQGLAAVLFNNMPETSKLDAIQLALDKPDATLEDARTLIRARFEKEANKIRGLK
jgi:hypothetical protein